MGWINKVQLRRREEKVARSNRSWCQVSECVRKVVVAG